ncbi:MAG: tRNA (guanosine(46)-N7)-methyltransferase TrmB [Clostridia bacterium]|nr:tRNA (guanosine(46)-N7)-methyltransferase TrmB [Clostridia bacterium]
MRMRRKNNLEERLALCKNSLLYIEGEEFYHKDVKDRFNILNLEEVFKNPNPIWLEIGCGKGQFALQTAKLNPNINVIAVEKISNVILSACERAEIEKPLNCKFLNCSAENLGYYLKNGSVERIFLNFSCPYPKHTYRNRRLTYHRFLSIYKALLAKDGEIHLKTDNAGFFEFSIESLSENGFKIKNVSLDLHNSDFKGNIETEYERLFSSQGKPIYRLEAYLT